MDAFGAVEKMGFLGCFSLFCVRCQYFIISSLALVGNEGGSGKKTTLTTLWVDLANLRPRVTLIVCHRFNQPVERIAAPAKPYL